MIKSLTPAGRLSLALQSGHPDAIGFGDQDQLAKASANDAVPMGVKRSEFMSLLDKMDKPAPVVVKKGVAGTTMAKALTGMEQNITSVRQLVSVAKSARTA